MREPENNPATDAAFVNITGVANIGGNPLSVTSSVEASAQVVDNVSYTRGLHFVKAGVDYQTTTFDNVAGLTRQFVFQGLPAAAGGAAPSRRSTSICSPVGRASIRRPGGPYNYSQLQQSFGERETAKRFGFVNAFAQDEIRVSPRVTLNAGLRDEFIVWPELDAQAPVRAVAQRSGRRAATSRRGLASRGCRPATPGRSFAAATVSTTTRRASASRSTPRSRTDAGCSTS